MKYKTLARVLVKLMAVFFFGWAIVSATEAVIQMLLQLTQRGGMSIVDAIRGYWPQTISYAVCGVIIWRLSDWAANRIIPSNRQYCHECGYDLSHAAGHVCPECGTAYRSEGAAGPHH